MRKLVYFYSSENYREMQEDFSAAAAVFENHSESLIGQYHFNFHAKPKHFKIYRVFLARTFKTSEK